MYSSPVTGSKFNGSRFKVGYPVDHKKESQPEEDKRKVEIKRKIKDFNED